MRIGILGGSFNPAHAGHRHISLIALQKLALDQVWWLVTPQNPLKPQAGMAPFAQRLEQARSTAGHPRIVVTDIEALLGTRFTADTLAALRARFRGARLVWLMGADNLRQIPHWERWQEIFIHTDIAVFARPPYGPGMLSAWAAQRFRRRRRARLGRARPDAGQTGWTFVHNRLHALSASKIRAAATDWPPLGDGAPDHS